VEPRDPSASLRGARHLWTGRFQATLSTHSVAEPGYPFGSLVPYCLDSNALPVLLLSHLAQHTRNLLQNPRCALTLAQATDGDLQRGDRLCCIGECTPVPAEETQTARRYFRYFPAGKVYFEELNFRFYRLIPVRFHFNGGFGTARWVGTEHIPRPSSLDYSEELELIAEIERRFPKLPDTRILPRSADDPPASIVGIDPQGMDLRRGERLCRTHFDATLERPESILAHLMEL
jgi:putative heme iron utilization protein